MATATKKKEEVRDDVQVTTLYGGKVVVKFYEKSHQYWVSRDFGKTFKRKGGVTSIIGIKDKSRPLGIWQQGMTLDFLLDTLERGIVIDHDKAVEAVIQHELYLEKAQDIGKEIHGWIEFYIRHNLKEKGYENLPAMPNFPEAITGVNAFFEWEKEHKVKWLSTERVVYSLKHDYVGQMDLEAMIDGLKCLSDFKSSNGLYNGVRMQTAAYQAADVEEKSYAKKIAKKDQYEGRWAIRFNKYSEEEYMKRELRKKEVKAAIARFKGQEVKDYPIKPYQVFEAQFLDEEPDMFEKDHRAFLICKELCEWDRATDSFLNGKGTL